MSGINATIFNPAIKNLKSTLKSLHFWTRRRSVDINYRVLFPNIPELLSEEKEQ